MRRLAASLLLICAIAMTACRATIAIPKESIPVGSARVVQWTGSDSSNSPADQVIVSHATDGWHVFLTWSPETGHCAPGSSRRLIVTHPPAGATTQIRHPCSGTTWDLDGRYVSGPANGSSDQHLVSLQFQENATTLVVDLAQQDAWQVVSSTTPLARPQFWRQEPLAPFPPTPAPAPTPTRIR